MASKPKIVESSEKLKDSADRRTELAADRTIFAAERTYAAWVRTGLVAMASGTGAKALLMDTLLYWLITATGSDGAAVWRHLYPGGRRRQCPMRLACTLRCSSSSMLCWH